MAEDALRFIKQNYAGPDEDIQGIFKLAHRLIERGKNLQTDRNTRVPERGPALSSELIQRRIQWAVGKILSDEPYKVPKVVYRDGPANITFDNESQTINITLPRVQMFTVPILDNSSILLCIRARTSKDVFGSYMHYRKGTLNVANYSAEYMGGRIITDFSPNGFTKYLGRLIYTGGLGE